jgi:hypothetical protein
MHFILIKPVLSNHLSYLTQCSLGRSHKTGLTAFLEIFQIENQEQLLIKSVFFNFNQSKNITFKISNSMTRSFQGRCEDLQTIATDPK